MRHVSTAELTNGENARSHRLIKYGYVSLAGLKARLRRQILIDGTGQPATRITLTLASPLPKFKRTGDRISQHQGRRGSARPGGTAPLMGIL